MFSFSFVSSLYLSGSLLLSLVMTLHSLVVVTVVVLCVVFFFAFSIFFLFARAQTNNRLHTLSGEW